MTTLELKTERMPAVSKRGISMPASPIRRLAPLAEAAKARGTRVLPLNIGQPDIETPPAMMSRLRSMNERVLEYSPSTGTPEFLRSMRLYYERRVGLQLETKQILATTGGSEAILFAFLACANEGDDILVVEPYYANYLAFATMAGVNLTPLTTRGRDGFHLPTRETWERALTPRTRAVIFSNPSNPTGTVYTRAELDVLADFCRDHGLFLISDEVYREFVYDGRKAVSALELSDVDELVIVIDSLSKRYSACGIRLGTLITRNADVYDACLRMAQGRLSPPGLAQFIAVGVDDLSDDYTNAVVREYQHRRDVLYAGLTSIPGVQLAKPEGAFYCIARLPVDDASHFSSWLLSAFEHDGATVMLSPASGFYLTPQGKSEVRIAYVLKEEDLKRAVEVLRAALVAYANRED
jgi:aspartate aminotransferase